MLPATLLHADYQDGLNAYAFGHYKRAMAEWKEVAAQPASEVNPAIYAEAHYAVARLYWDGQGVSRDFYQAREWLEKAADLGHAGAMAKLGYMYTDGLTVDQDFDTAFELYSEAARLGDVDGLYNLGIFYLNGWGTEQDTTRAKQYLAAASAQGDQAAEQALQQLMAMEDGEVTDGEVVTCGSGFSRDTDCLEDIAAEAAPTVIEAVPGEESRLKPLPQSEVRRGAIQDEAWILAQPPTHYTIQAIGLRRRETLLGLLEGHEDLAPVAIYVVQKETNPIHVLVYGAFPTVEEARAARDVFPRAINPPDQVWIRRFEKVQEIIRQENGL